MISDLTLPTGETVKLVFLRKWPNVGDMIYLQSIRSGRLNEGSDTATSYRNMACFYARLLADEVHDKTKFDSVVSPPSTRADAMVYRESILESILPNSNVPDLSGGFSRKERAKAASASSLEEIVDEFVYKADGHEATIESLLIVDDSIASGKTIAAMLHHLRKAGLPLDCMITVAVPAWLNEGSN